MTTSEIQHLFSDHFTYLHKVVNELHPTGNWRDRGPRVMAFPELQRDLYFVWDVVCITCNAGMGAWIHYHIEDDGWIDDAARAFEAIGQRSLGDHLRECRERYRDVNGEPDRLVDEDLSSLVWQTEDQILQDLYQHLVSAKFVFRRPEDFHRILEREKEAKRGTPPNRA